IHTITNIQANLPKKPSPPLQLHSNFHHLNPQINPTPNPTQQQKQHPIQTFNPKTHQVNNLINQHRRDNEVQHHKNIPLQELQTIHANPTR
uniref:DUF1542 domain-containing protein n=1 Tax=Staphylococcus epidermidis TaxID=1282 RepID=UPI0011AA1C84